MLKQIGVLWRKESKNGEFLSGQLDMGAMGSVQIGVFQNELDDEDREKNKPTARIVLFQSDKNGE